MSKEPGRVENRPSRVLYASWMEGTNEVPLELAQTEDEVEMKRLYDKLHDHPVAAKYFLCEMVFPACIKQQKVKLSASGQELGSDMIFR